MARYFNITGASSAAAELTRELLSPGAEASVNKISLTNIQGTHPCTVDLYIEKVNRGKFYIFKGIELPVGNTFVHGLPKFSNKSGQYGLYLKLNKSASETPSVDVILY
jgi:hypothetical protein